MATIHVLRPRGSKAPGDADEHRLPSVEPERAADPAEPQHPPRRAVLCIWHVDAATGYPVCDWSAG
jgi:hypothetical protein